jgi:hypothetical protein
VLHNGRKEQVVNSFTPRKLCPSLSDNPLTLSPNNLSCDSLNSNNLLKNLLEENEKLKKENCLLMEQNVEIEKDANERISWQDTKISVIHGDFEEHKKRSKKLFIEILVNQEESRRREEVKNIDEDLRRLGERTSGLLSEEKGFNVFNLDGWEVKEIKTKLVPLSLI